MSQPEQKEQPKKGGIPRDNSMFFWAFMDSSEFKRKNLTGLKKTISKPEIEKKIPAQIPCRQCKLCLVDNPANSDEVHRGYCPRCCLNR